MSVCKLFEMIGAEAGSRTRTTLRSTDFKSVARVLTSFCYALPSRIYRRFSRQSKLTSGLVQTRNALIFASSFQVIVHEAAIRVCRYFLAKEIPIERVRISFHTAQVAALIT